MKITACLAWYDENPDDLARCVTSLEGIADHLIELDGPWQGMPHDHHASPREQQDALREAAYAIGLPVISIAKGDAYASQVQKRDQLMKYARTRTDADWLLVIDADEAIEPNAMTLALWHALENTEHDVALVTLRNIHHDTEYSGPIRRLYRASTGVHVPGPAHMAYVTSDGRYLHGDPAYVQLEPPESSTAAMLTIAHDSSHRTAERQAARLAYRNHRNRERTEAWQAA